MIGYADIPDRRIRELAQDPRFLAAMDELFAQLDASLSGRNPQCKGCGQCCRFEEYDHRLFVTSAELAWFLAKTKPPCSEIRPGICPYQRENQCSARRARPSGCRIFFCSPSPEDWQGPVTEKTLEQLREIHDAFELPYVYVEWLHALKQLFPA